MPETTPLLGQKFAAALQMAAWLHRDQVRKGTSVPYVSHLMAVASLALENGADEDEAVAALLHDAVEDAGGRPMLEGIRAAFGERVAEIVDGCTDAWEDPKPAWLSRKRAYLAHLAAAGPSIRLVSASDKLHNARAILSDLRDQGESVWDRFSQKKTGTLWYYRALADAFLRHGPERLARELDATVSAIEQEFNNGHKLTDPGSV